MKRRVGWLRVTSVAATWMLCVWTAGGADLLEPFGQKHIPIGIPNTLDSLKTFVEAEGNFSPGFASFGVSYWVYDHATKRAYAPTMPDVPSTHGLAGVGWLIPWTEWRAGDVKIRTEVCQVQRTWNDQPLQIVGARVHLTNESGKPGKIRLNVLIAPKGAAGSPIQRLEIDRDALLVNDQPALIANEMPTGGQLPAPEPADPVRPAKHLARNEVIQSKNGMCTGVLSYDVELKAGGSKTLGFVLPVLHGRRAVRHEWDGVNTWAQIDEADPIRGRDGVEQPSPGVEFYHGIGADNLFAEAERYWKEFVGKVEIDVPDRRWAEAFAAITGHAAMTMNEGAPDLAVINYNVFNRGGVYLANILQKSGNPALAREAIDYFLRHPFSGRIEPEADNPGQIAWILGEHWRLTRDREWLSKVWPSAQKIAALIEYYRTTQEPHWVSMTSLDFGDALPVDDRKHLRPGACDGHQPEYTEAFDIAGLRAVALLAREMNDAAAEEKWSALADQLMKSYDERFGEKLREHEYSDYSVLWPCRLYPLNEGRGREQFLEVGAQTQAEWRYFALARAHQGLLAGNREAGHGTLAAHLDHEQMRGWYALDEGGPSGPGSWSKALSNWAVENDGPNGASSAVAMPHGWAIAEFQLLLRDSLVFEDGDRLVLFAGVPAEWFDQRMAVKNLPTAFGTLSFEWEKGTLKLGGDCAPAGGFVLRLPDGDVAIAAGEKEWKRGEVSR